ncbi:MAG: RdgB/HAM1 family non-canonical purine NTP pyrophosphatase [Alphaproteobacteria bacterium]|nr:RdgB/HAM1 family non-canonical purine NTP pyrophosphatase [Alphaproteobacteria bacterium]MBU0858347.1 RdgB/HAM1 family non-canonical purine NTP pyrophosphatase [Alphaproteobacteria bacterium]
MRKFSGDQLVLATHNAGKVKEIAALLAPFAVTVTAAGDMGLPEPDETEDTFIGNAKLKALAAATASGLPALADDSGVCVNGLNGEPGIYSARWAGPGKDFSVAMEKVNTLLADNPDRTAYFISALALAWPDGHCEIFEGRIDGNLIWPPRGSNGFGYDPMFIPEGFDITFGEMDPAAKHAISHRARAFAMLVDGCFA